MREQEEYCPRLPSKVHEEQRFEGTVMAHCIQIHMHSEYMSADSKNEAPPPPKGGCKVLMSGGKFSIIPGPLILLTYKRIFLLLLAHTYIQLTFHFLTDLASKMKFKPE